MPNQKPQAAGITFTIVVQGQPVSLTRGADAPLSSTIEEALKRSKNDAGQPQEAWELRDANGTLLDLSKTLADYALLDGVTLYLSLRAGVGG